VYPPAALVVVAAVVAGSAADLVAGAVAPPRWRAERAAPAGDLGAAERLHWDLFARGPVELPALLDFLEYRCQAQHISHSGCSLLRFAQSVELNPPVADRLTLFLSRLRW
jgi:hypothetical protein